MLFNKERLRLYLGALLVFQVVTCGLHLPLSLAGKTDFRTFYATAHMLRSGHLYDYDAEVAAQNALVSPNASALPFMFPPYAALMFAPLAHFSYRAAYWIFFALNLCFCGLSADIMVRFCPALRSRWAPTVPLIFFSFMPLGTAIMCGQVSILLLLLYCSCFAAVQKGRLFFGGILLALALIKFQIALPVALLFLIWRQWRFIAGFATGGAALALISAAITGVKPLGAYLCSLVSMAAQTQSETKFAMFSAEMPNLYGFFHTLLAGRPGLILTVIFSAAAMVRTAFQKPSLPLALLAGMLVSFHLFPYDLTLLLLPIVLVLNAALESPQSRPVLYASAFMILLPLFKPFVGLDYQFLFVVPLAVLFLFFGELGALPSKDVPSHAIVVSDNGLVAT